MKGPIYRVLLTHAAEDDLADLHEYMSAHRSAAAADALEAKLLARVASLDHLPHRGAIPKELAALGIQDFRQLLLDRYRILYRVIGEMVIVLLIADGRREMDPLLQRRLLCR